MPSHSLTYHESSRLASLVAARLDLLTAQLAIAAPNSTRAHSIRAEIAFWSTVAGKLAAPHLVNR